MRARNGAIRWKPDTLRDFGRSLEASCWPSCASKRGSSTKSRLPCRLGSKVVAISLWDTTGNREAYHTAGYPEVLKRVDKVLDGAPRRRVSMSSARASTRLHWFLPDRFVDRVGDGSGSRLLF